MSHALQRCARSLAAIAGLCVAACSVYDAALLSTAEGDAIAAVTSQSGSAGQPPVLVPTSCVEGAPCALPNAIAVCRNYACLVAECEPPFADCDMLAYNGCEARLDSAVQCGQCGHGCSFDHATARCDDGLCELDTCEAGFGDCDGDPSNGCEARLDTNADCGECGVKCHSSGQTQARCEAGICQLSCAPGYADCNQDPRDGCEQSLNESSSCGACGVDCRSPHVTASACNAGQCLIIACAAGYEDCNELSIDGCESDLLGKDNCGGCGVSCALPHADQVYCSATESRPQCLIDTSSGSGCKPGYADCDGDPRNGCESGLQRKGSCGACGAACAVPHTLTDCQDSHCVSVGCEEGYGLCGGSDVCISLLDDPSNCGACGRSCGVLTPFCRGGVCTSQICNRGVADCDGNPDNGCELGIEDLTRCGGCQLSCQGLLAFHAQPQCQNGMCTLAQCNEGFADCDGDPLNGCEADLNAIDSCGGCSQVCGAAHGETECTDRSCQIVQCDEGRADCNQDVSDGCEADLNSRTHCGACDHYCGTAPHAANSCRDGNCVTVCQSGFADCDDTGENGCETDLSAATHCGACDNDCTQLPNVAAARCADSTCGVLMCTPGFKDCNGIATDGCEAALDSVQHCGACNQPCRLAHAQATCENNTCRMTECEPGFGDCNGDPRDGCESSLDSAEHCGACRLACRSGSTCDQGQCACERDEDCGTGEQCCSGRCTDTAGSCSLWPCAPGTALPDNQADCGGCGQRCRAWCCGPL